MSIMYKNLMSVNFSLGRTKFLTKLSGKKFASPLELRVQSFEIFGKTFGENNDELLAKGSCI